MEYMSPEQADRANHSVDRAADVYSLGVVVYELLCGALPCDAARLREAGLTNAFRMIRDEEPPRPSDRLRRLGPAAGDVARKRSTSVAGLQRGVSGDIAPNCKTIYGVS
jgi:serine/threonine protein kinase